MRPRRLKHEINVVPYIDVMLVLLVIFMVTAPMMQITSVDLPSVGQGNPPQQQALEVVVRADGSLALRDALQGGREWSVSREQLASELSVQRDRPVLISGDKAVRYAAVLAVMDELQRARVGKIGLMVRTEK